MRLEHLYVEHFQGVVHADIDLSVPITLIAGPNGAGKSSLKEAIGLALGMPARVAQKKDYARLVTDGHKKARITLKHDGMTSSITLPAGKAERSDIPGGEYLPYVLTPGAFAALDDKGRRKLLFALTKSSASPNATAALLLERGADAAKVEAIKPLLVNGFAAAQDQAKSYATESRGAWKAITGENYGSEKAEGWQVKLPEGPVPTGAELDAIMAKHLAVTASIEKGVKFLGGLESKREASAGYAARKATAEATATLLGRRQAKLAATAADIAEWEPKLADMQTRLTEMEIGADGCDCPGCGLTLKIVGKKLEPFQSLKADVKAKTDLALELNTARKAVDLLKRTQQNDLTAVAESKAAQKTLAAIMEEQIEGADDELIKRTEDALTSERLKAEQLRAEFNAKQERKNLFDDADKIVSKAAGHHEDVKAWTLIENALAPDGIPGEILAGALKPFNSTLARTSALAGWAKVQIDASMSVTANDRSYMLLSESERWRADTLLGLAIALQSGLKTLVLDSFDVLDMPSRNQCIGMLLTLAKSGELESAVVCGTLKEMPKTLPPEIQAVWIADGTAGEPQLQKSA
jgi:hypothetical protein